MYILSNQSIALPTTQENFPKNTQLGSLAKIVNKKSTKNRPWRWICSIIVTFPEKVYKPGGGNGTGFRTAPVISKTFTLTGVLITPRHVLTVAHGLIGLSKNGRQLYPKKIEVIPGRHDERNNQRPFGAYRHQGKPLVMTGFLNNSRKSVLDFSPYDIGLIKLRRKRGVKSWWGDNNQSFIKTVDKKCRHQLRNRSVNVAGYPLFLSSTHTSTQTPAGIPDTEFVRVKKIYRSTDYSWQNYWQISYQSNSKDKSGSPVWIMNKNSKKRYLIGIHIGRTVSGNGQGVLFTSPIVEWIERKIGLNVSFALDEKRGGCLNR